MSQKTCIKFTKKTPVGSAMYSTGDVAVFRADTAEKIVKQNFAIFWNPGKKAPVPSGADATPEEAGPDQVRREEAKAKGAEKQPVRK